MDIYQHFRKEEHPFIDQVLSWMEQVERNYLPKLTDFLDPREQQIVEMLIGKENAELQLKLAGGAEIAERKRAVIAPFYEQIGDEMFELICLEALFPSKFTNIMHSDVMGAFLSLGLRRNKLGDIYVKDGLIQLLLTGDISSYVLMNLTMIKNVRMSFKEIPFSRVKSAPESWRESNHTVSSLRLDVIVKEIYNVPRKEAVTYITKGLVKL